MAYTIRISLPGYDAKTDDNPDHYALYGDEDWVLIKEKSRGSGTLAYNGSASVAHGLEYIPMVFLWGENSNGDLIFQGITNFLSAQDEWFVELDSSNVVITQLVGEGDFDYKYYIFYDELE